MARVQRQRGHLEGEIGIEADEDAGVRDPHAGAIGAIEVGQAALEVGARVVGVGAHELGIQRPRVGFLKRAHRQFRLHRAVGVARHAGEQRGELRLVDRADVDEHVVEPHRLRRPQRFVDVGQRPRAVGGAVFAGQQRHGVHAAAVQDPQLLDHRRGCDAVSRFSGAVVAAHAAHAALGVAGVGHVQRREGFELPTALPLCAPAPSRRGPRCPPAARTTGRPSRRGRAPRPALALRQAAARQRRGLPLAHAAAAPRRRRHRRRTLGCANSR